MRDNIIKLINSGITAHTVATESGLPRNTVYRIFTGEAKLDNVSLKNAEILNEYYLKNEEEIEMKKVMDIIEKVFVENDKVFVNYFESLDMALEDGFDEESLNDNFYVYGEKDSKVSDINGSFIMIEVAGATDTPVFNVNNKSDVLSYLQDNHKEYIK